MVVLNKIYTRTGDDGTTALGNGERRRKFDIRVSAYGAIDELNAVLGMARLETARALPDLDAALTRIQNDLFDLGADLATPHAPGEKEGERLRIAAGQVAWLESEIDRLNENLEPLRSFVLPGGSAASAHLHLARTVARRAERDLCLLGDSEPIGEPAVQYVNRLSDFLFVAARVANDGGKSDVLWVPGKNR